jgi:hypothetical protein
MPQTYKDLLQWTPEHRKRFTRDNLLFGHDLHTSELFSDEALISLIDRFPREGVEVFTMGYDPTNWKQWFFGRRSNRDGSDLDGRQLMEGVRAGRLWLNLRKVNHHDASVGALCDRMFEEISAKTSISTLKPDLGLLISSPNGHVFYHLDIPLVMLWQIRGVKTVYLYPPQAPCVSDEVLEGIALRESDEQMRFDPAYDRLAYVHDLKPGEMLTWVQNAPHRIVNRDMVNVSLSIEFMTPKALWRANLIYANGLLRRFFGLKPSLARRNIWLEPFKIAYARFIKLRGGYKGNKSPLKPSFHLDASRPGTILFDDGVIPPERPSAPIAAE